MSSAEASAGLGVGVGVGVGLLTGNPMLGIAAGGAAMSVSGGLMGASAQGNAMEREAYFKRLQADELLARQKINEEIMREQGEESKRAFGSAMAASGVSNTGLGGKIKIHERVQEAITLTRRDAEFKARMIRAGADIQDGLASDQMTAAWITGAGSLIGAGAGIWSNYSDSKTKTAKPIPGVT